MSTVPPIHREVVVDADPATAVWGTVIRWEPPAALAFTWYPGKTADRASQVEVTFTAVGRRLWSR